MVMKTKEETVDKFLGSGISRCPKCNQIVCIIGAKELKKLWVCECDCRVAEGMWGFSGNTEVLYHCPVERDVW